MTIDAAKRLTELGNRFTPKLRTALLQAFADMQGLVSDRELLRAVETRGLAGVFEILDGMQASGMALGPVRDLLEDAAITSGRGFFAVIPPQGMLARYQFSSVNPATAKYLNDYSFR